MPPYTLLSLQVLESALLLVSCAAFTMRYPDPLDCHNYCLRIDDRFYHIICPSNFVFVQYKEQCIPKDCTLPKIMPLNATDCSQNKEGYYFTADYRFTYCTHHGLKIVENAACPSGMFCRGKCNKNPCVV